jgi:prolyl-tRNA editing enzyme YbaK/EbsC (Cys-tRNA(Pro) deacylase)
MADDRSTDPQHQAAMSALANRSVQRFAAALAAAGAEGALVELAATARTAEEAAAALAVPVGAIVKSLVFIVAGQPVLALVAGDRRCRTDALAQALGRSGPVERASAAEVRDATGYAIGGVPPLGHTLTLPTAIDASLGRFRTLYAAAGHPHCVFPTTLAELRTLTRGTLSEAIAAP